MIRLIFSGSLPILPSAPQLRAFVSDSQSRNRRHGIHGAMILMQRDFMQVIEGPQETVDQMYDQLSQSSHRYGLVLVSRQENVRPLFPDWHLGLIQPPPFGTEPDPREHAAYLMLQKAEGADADQRDTLKTMREFIRGQWHRNQIDNDQPIVLRRQRKVF
ncbi:MULTISPECIES: BLUF domain-containing protein [unclassified Paludibacterium]|uniref:BLUF domain-containing protein n=1 Tax=unclassified Paludibacterium TaxID=2618429 RepID=UPI001C03CE4E|nr:BLUF domain-containing protein [Paludibacterium sp. B53371]BEV71867.1 hypothetical protein THUN1379_13490 [Paludibacterium sp. THUN1379]